MLSQTTMKMWRDVKGISASGEGHMALAVCGIDGIKCAEISGGGDVTVDTSALPRGIYVVTATTDSERRTRKIRIGNMP